MDNGLMVENFTVNKNKKIFNDKVNGKNQKGAKGKGLRMHIEKMRTDPNYRQMMVEKYKNNRPNAIEIDMLDKETMEIVKTFPKIMDGAAWIRENTPYVKADYATINKICKKQGKTAYGYKWRYTKDR